MTDFYRIMDAIGQSDEPCVLATIIRVEGSAYRKEGAAMLIKEDGSRIGMISGGCMEQDIAARVDDLLRTEKSQTIVYDMRTEDPISWGQSAGCNGLVHVLVEPIYPRLRNHIRMAKTSMDQGIPITCVRRLDSERSVTDYWFVPHRDAESFGSWSGDVPYEYQLQGSMDERKNSIRYMNDGLANVFIQTCWPKPRLILFGAGEDARPVAALAARVGFSITVADWRPAYCNKTHFPDADVHLVGFPDEIGQRLLLSDNDSAVIMSHHFERDRQFLELLLQNKLNYVGVLGPRHRTFRLLDGREVPDYVRSPVGLPIGAEGPDEIAVSIVAELIQAHRSPSVREGVRP